jgi:hypothetical protein
MLNKLQSGILALVLRLKVSIVSLPGYPCTSFSAGVTSPSIFPNIKGMLVLIL